MAEIALDTDYHDELRTRGAARAPVSYGDIWQAEWRRAGLDTLGGIGRPMGEATDELANAIENASGTDLASYAADKNVPLGSAVTIDQRVRLLNQLADTLPEDARKTVDPLRDARSRAGEKAKVIEHNASDVAAGTYGMSGAAVGFAAGLARQAVDPANIATGALAGPVSGLVKGPILHSIVSGGVLAGSMVALEPAIEAERKRLALEPGAGVDIAVPVFGAAGLAGLFRVGAWGMRQVSRVGRGLPPIAPPKQPAGPEPSVPPPAPQASFDFYNRVRNDIGPDDLDAAAVLAERNQVMDASRPGVEQAPKIDEAASAMEIGKPVTTVEPINAKFTDDTRALIRPGGARLEVKPAVVELGDLIASHDLEGRVNPAYPAELQPRDRSAPASRTWIAEKAAELEPRLLTDAPTAGLGAPVIGPDGVVESGNGRVMLIARAYDRHPERAAAYRSALEEQGYQIADMKHPVLVRMREGELSMAERAKLATEANVSQTAGMSTRERAAADAKRLDSQLLATYRGGSVSSAENAPFVRAFADRVVAPEERPQFIGGDNRLSAEGARRVEAALVQRAWNAPDVVTALYETADPSSRAILGAMADSAPAVARLRAAIDEGRIPASADPVPAMLDAYRLVERARNAGQKIGDVVNQIDIEHGAVPEPVREAVKLYFRDDAMRQAAGRETVAARMQKAVERALDHQNALGDLFGAQPTAVNALREGKLGGTSLEDMPIAPDLVPGAPKEAPAPPAAPPEKAPPAPGAPAEKPLGDPIKAQEFERTLTELGGDMEITLADGTKRSARELIAEARADAKAAAELEACIGATAEAAE